MAKVKKKAAGKAPAARGKATKKTSPKKSAAKAAKGKSTAKAKDKPAAAARATALRAAAPQKPAPMAAEQDEGPSLGRPKVTQEEKLFMLFKEDYHARQIFDFLRVETVKELEQFTPQEILKRLSEPIRQTVERIRRKLAEKNRSLASDEEFALKHKPQ